MHSVRGSRLRGQRAERHCVKTLQKVTWACCNIYFKYNLLAKACRLEVLRTVSGKGLPMG